MQFGADLNTTYPELGQSCGDVDSILFYFLINLF